MNTNLIRILDRLYHFGFITFASAFEYGFSGDYQLGVQQGLIIYNPHVCQYYIEPKGMELYKNLRTTMKGYMPEIT
jgi:hypothetical protein